MQRTRGAWSGCISKTEPDWLKHMKFSVNEKGCISVNIRPLNPHTWVTKTTCGWLVFMQAKTPCLNKNWVFAHNFEEVSP